MPAALIVSSLADTGAGSLRAAITAADAAGGNQQIGIQPGLAGAIMLESDLPDLTANISINGSQSSVTVERDPHATTDFRIFTVDANSTSSITALSIAGGLSDSGGGGVWNGGNLTLSNDAVYGNTASTSDGGGILNRYGTLSVQACDIYGNSADATVGLGGGIYNYGVLDISSGTTQISDNVALRGAGIYNDQTGFVYIESYCSINDNTAGQLGGGVDNLGDFTMYGGAITDNTANGNGLAIGGGGFYNGANGVTNAQATLNDVTITGNSANKGGGFYLYAQSTLTLNECYISGNTAPTGNGICYQTGASYTLNNCTVINQSIVKDPDF